MAEGTIQPRPGYQRLTLESLKDVKGGMVGAMLRKALERMAADLEAAPDINDWRTVTLEIRSKPVMENLQLASASFEFVVKGKVPARVTSASMHVRAAENGERYFIFNVDAPDNPDQLTFNEIREVDAHDVE